MQAPDFIQNITNSLPDWVKEHGGAAASIGLSIAGGELIHRTNLSPLEQMLAKAGLSLPMLKNMIYENIKESWGGGPGKNMDLADLLMHGLNGGMAAYGILTPGEEGAHALRTANITTAIFYGSKAAEAKIEEGKVKMMVDFAREIPGMEFSEEDVHIGHTHGPSDDVHDHAHEHDHEHDEVPDYTKLNAEEIEKHRSEDNNLVFKRVKRANGTIIPGGFEYVHPRQINVDDEILIEGGQNIPADGEVIDINGKPSNSAILDNKLYRGEDEDEVYAGVVVLQAAKLKGHDTLKMKVKKEWHESSGVHRFEAISENTDPAAHETNLNKAIDTYVELLLGAGFLYFFKDAVKMHKGKVLDFSEFNLKKAIDDTFGFVVSAAPCPLVATTLFYTNYSNALRDKGTDIRKIGHFEKAKDVKSVVLDITKTITDGNAKVKSCIGIQTNGENLSNEETLKIAAQIESGSTHATAKAILNHARKQGIDVESERNDRIENVDGGRRGFVDGAETLIGNRRFYDNINMELPSEVAAKVSEAEATGDIVSIIKHGDKWGLVTTRDEVRKEAKDVVASLKRRGIKVYIATGLDNETRVRQVAEEIGLSPEEIENNVYFDLKAEPENAKAFIGNREFFKKNKIIIPGHIMNEASEIESTSPGKQAVITYFNGDWGVSAEAIPEKHEAYGISSVILAGKNAEEIKVKETGFAENEVETKKFLKQKLDAFVSQAPKIKEPDTSKYREGIYNKVDVIKKLQHDGITMMVGDGGNDAPAMEAADIAVGMKDTAVGMVSDTASMIVKDLNEVALLPARAQRVDRFSKIFAGATMLWMGVLTTFHLLGSKIEKVLGFNPPNALKGFLHESATIVATAVGFVAGNWMANDDSEKLKVLGSEAHLTERDMQLGTT